MSTLKDRLSLLIEGEKLNPNQFYVKTGLANGFLDKVGSKMNRSTVEKIEKAFPHWNIDYLVFGKGQMMKTTSFDKKTGIREIKIPEGGSFSTNEGGVFLKGTDIDGILNLFADKAQDYAIKLIQEGILYPSAVIDLKNNKINDLGKEINELNRYIGKLETLLEEKKELTKENKQLLEEKGRLQAENAHLRGLLSDNNITYKQTGSD